MSENLETKINNIDLVETEVDQEVKGFTEVLKVNFNAKSGTLLLDLDRAGLIDPNLLQAVEPDGFKPKDELHLTIIGFKQGKLIKDAIKANPGLATKIEEIALATQWDIQPTGEKYKLAKTYEGEDTTRETIIEMLQCPGSEDFIAKLNILTGLNLEEQPPHVTLLTKGNAQGIGVNTAQDILELGTKITERSDNN